jgi:succinyl-CoA synthetase beta subunit
MNLHEYQAKEILQKYGVATPDFMVVDDYMQVEQACSDLGGNKWVVKAQVHAGGRGKAGGVKVSADKQELTDFVRNLQGTRLITYQTDQTGQPINQFLIEKASDIAQELYFGLTIDRSLKQVVCLISKAGGMDIEKVSAENPNAIIKKRIEPMLKGLDFQAKEIGFELGFNKDLLQQFTVAFKKLVNLFFEKDLTMLEINPLAITNDNQILCLDAKFDVDNNALFRQKELLHLRDLTQENEIEVEASKFGLNYISLDGNIACMVNGAGLAMATMDMIALYGGSPANFLDVGGSTNSEKVARAFKIILSNEKVKVVFINIFGGIVKCDIIASGVLEAIAEVGTSLPIIVRLEGNNSNIARQMLNDSGVSNIVVAETSSIAAQKAVELAK